MAGNEVSLPSVVFYDNLRRQFKTCVVSSGINVGSAPFYFVFCKWHSEKIQKITKKGLTYFFQRSVFFNLKCSEWSIQKVLPYLISVWKKVVRGALK